MYKSQVELLKMVIPTLNIRPEEEIKLSGLQEAWDETPECLIRYFGGWDKYTERIEHGVADAYAVLVGSKGIVPLAVKKDYVFGDWDPEEGDHVPTVGEQLACRRVLYVVIRRVWEDSTGSVDIYIGPGSPARYLRWRILKAAREMCGLLSELEPLCPQRPAAASGSKRSRRRLLDSAGK